MKKKVDQGMVENVKFSRTSVILFASALLTLIVGYIFMAKGDIAVSPVLLILGYVVLIPTAIMKK